MLRFMVGVIGICCIYVMPRTSEVQQQSISTQPEAKRLVSALDNLRRAPDDPKAQQAYLDAFPHTYTEFVQLFDGPLSDGHEYISMLSSLGDSRKTEVGKLLIQLAKDAHYEADAPSYLQHVTATYGSEHPAEFAILLKQLSPKSRSNLITFLADVENHSSYQSYQNIITELRARHETTLAMQFQVAREKRQQRHSH